MNQQFPSLEEEFVVIERVGDHEAACDTVSMVWCTVVPALFLCLPNIDMQKMF